MVGKEGEDLSRHDKWLCMMYPRLKLLHRLLAKDGVIFISIDDNEQANLRLICDEIFGSANFIANIIWQKKHAPQGDATYFSVMHDYLFVYAKKSKSHKYDLNGFSLLKLERTEIQNNRYKNPDNDPRGVWTSDNYTCNKNSDERPNLYYPVINPNTNEEIWPSKTSVWRYSQERHLENWKNNLITWGADGRGRPRFKRFIDVVSGVVPSTWWTREFAGDNQEARKEFRKIFSEDETDFTTPKPSKLIEQVLQLATNKNSIILDSFAGSGTTAHAVLKLNAQDGGNRRFILIEMEDYADTITAERVRRVMSGYGEGNKQVLGLGGSFAYYTIGEPIFNPDDTLNEAVGIDVIRNYVAYSEGIPGEDQTAQDNDYTPYLMGLNSDTAWLFYYEPKQVTCLDLDFLGSLKFGAAKPGTAIIYADKCLLTKVFMTKYGIIFKKIPRDITRF